MQWGWWGQTLLAKCGHNLVFRIAWTTIFWMQPLKRAKRIVWGFWFDFSVNVNVSFRNEEILRKGCDHMSSHINMTKFNKLTVRWCFVNEGFGPRREFFQLFALEALHKCFRGICTARYFANNMKAVNVSYIFIVLCYVLFQRKKE